METRCSIIRSSLAETGDVWRVLRLHRCHGEADPGGRGEVFRYLAPCRIVGGAALVAFIDRDRVEKAGRELPVRLPVCLLPGDRPAETGTELECRIDAALPVDGPRHVDPAAIVALDCSGVGRQIDHRLVGGAQIVHRDRESRSRRRRSPRSLHCSSFYSRFSEKRLRSSIIALISDSRTFDRSWISASFSASSDARVISA